MASQPPSKPVDQPLPAVVTQPPFEIRTACGKGKGLFATRPIRRGTRIMSEQPLLKYPIEGPNIHGERIMSTFEQLDSERRQIFLSLYHDHPHRTLGDRDGYAKDDDDDDAINRVVSRIVQLNGMAIETDGGLTEGGVFEWASRMNHSCVPNVHCSTSTERLHVVHATRDILVGEEVEYSYIAGSFLPRRERQALLGLWGFQCQCTICSVTDPKALIRSDRNRRDAFNMEQRLSRVRIDMGNNVATMSPMQFREAAELCVLLEDIMRREKMHEAQIADLCIGAYMCFRLAGNNASASKWRYRARDLVKTCYGTDSALYRETFGSGSDQII